MGVQLPLPAPSLSSLNHSYRTGYTRPITLQSELHGQARVQKWVQCASHLF